LLKGQTNAHPREYLIKCIDDFSRELYAAIFPDKTQDSAAQFLQEHVSKHCPYSLDYLYSDNRKEFKGTTAHALVKVCLANDIGQKFTRVSRPQTNAKAERVIRTLMDMWHEKIEFTDSEHRRVELNRFINFYNTAKPHKGLQNRTPYEILDHYFSQKV
jgi:transposase InsO family protein